MTYDELLTARDALETALLAGGATSRLKIGDREVEYSSVADVRRSLNMVNRAIARYNQQAAGYTPGIRTASFENG